MGYHLAGFEVVGVDINRQPRYPFRFVQADALEFPTIGFDLVHASPPCQRYTDYGARHPEKYPDLIETVRDKLLQAQIPYVIENVDRAPLIDPITLCGTMFPALRVIRHRKFECSFEVEQPFHISSKDHPLVYTTDKRQPHYGALDQDRSFVTVTGGANCSVENARKAMGITWYTTKRELNEAIPPAYTKYIGSQFLQSCGS